LPLYALLKLVAFSDRREPKDLAGVLHCLENYLEDSDRRYTIEHEGEGVLYEYSSAYLLGVDARPFLDPTFGQSVTAVLDRFDSPEAVVIRIVANEKGRFIGEDDERTEIFERFRWFRLGTGL
jgi:predicted nucleotidyltransferase